MSDKTETGFKVSDRRKFNTDGSLKDVSAEETNVVELPQPAVQAERQPSPKEGAASTTGGDNILSFPGESAKKKEPEPASAIREAAQADQLSERDIAINRAAEAYNHVSSGSHSHLPEPSFLSIANMLGIEAAMHLGLIEAAPGAGVSVDLDSSRHIIDLIVILQEKTRGNLTHEEDTLLDNMLADLRMQFVAASSRR